jgi:hypothetical protein
MRVAICLMALLLFEGCASQPPRPAMVPQVQPDGFGYSETRLADDRYEVRYVTPDVPLPVDDTRRLAALTAGKQRAYDLALWRAAQVARDRGYGALTVEQDHRDADVTFRRETVPVAGGVYGPYPGWGYGAPYGYRRFGFASPFWFYNDPFAYRIRLRVTGRITAALVVAFAKSPSPGSQDSNATAQRLAKQYSGAVY